MTVCAQGGGYHPDVEPTPGYWLRRLHESDPVKRLRMTEKLADAANQGSRCSIEMREEEIAGALEGLRIPLETLHPSTPPVRPEMLAVGQSRQLLREA